MTLVVFDLDGVLIDSREANYQAFARGLKEVGKYPSPSEVSELIGHSAQEMLRRLGCPEADIEGIYQQVVKPHYFEHLPDLAQAVPEASRVLDQLRQRGHRLAACTSGDRSLQERALRHIGLWEYLEAMQTPDDSRFHKPQVEYLQELVDRLDYQGPMIHVEDSQIGLQMGLDWGATTVFADYGFGRPEPLQPHHRISGLAELLEIVK